jgi:Right handed beta helix region
VQGNFIGTDASGTAALGGPRQVFGVAVRSPGNNMPHNVISANDVGVHLLGASGNVLQSNSIGTDNTGTVDLGNTFQGVLIEDSFNNMLEFESGNTIAFNGTGVAVRSGTGNRFLFNSIFSNDGLGIDLSNAADDGVTPNDAGDGDSGGNELQNFPVLTSALDDGDGTVTVSGTLDSEPDTTYRISLFANSACDPSGHGEGESFQAIENVTTDGTGHADFTVPIFEGGFITALATDPEDNTSEFSNCIPVAPAPRECADGVDNDGDGRVDFPSDRGCRSAADPSERTDCDDGVDNDGDGFVDRADRGCSSRKDKTETAQCEDGVDNDRDGDVDFPADPGCTSPVDNKERSQCDDGVDNDNDGATDFPEDTGCRSLGDNRE